LLADYFFVNLQNRAELAATIGVYSKRACSCMRHPAMNRNAVCPHCGARFTLSTVIREAAISCPGCLRPLRVRSPLSDTPTPDTPSLPVPPPRVNSPSGQPCLPAAIFSPTLCTSAHSQRHPSAMARPVHWSLLAVFLAAGLIIGWYATVATRYPPPSDKLALDAHRAPAAGAVRSTLPVSLDSVRASDRHLARDLASIGPSKVVLPSPAIDTKPMEPASPFKQQPRESSPSPATSSGDSLADLIEKVEPSIVRVDVYGQTSRGHGSGFVIDREGRIITNFHVISEAVRAEVVFKDGFTAPVLGTLAALEKQDLAVLQVKCPADRLTPIRIAATLPRKGERVAAFGAPLGFSFTASDGLVSALRSGEELDGEFLNLHMPLHSDPRQTWIQTTAPISKGNSGGPLVNLRGEVVGVNTLSIPQLGQNLNFAVSCLDVSSAVLLGQGQVQPLKPRPAPGMLSQPPHPAPPGGVGPEFVDIRSTPEGNRLLANVRKIKVAAVIPKNNPAIFNAVSQSIEAAIRHCQEVLRAAGIQLTETNDPEGAEAVILLRFNRITPQMLDCQVEFTVLRARPAEGGPRQIVNIWSESGRESVPMAAMLDPSRFSPKLDHRLTALCHAFCAERQQLRAARP